jgi:hypothetical protein
MLEVVGFGSHSKRCFASAGGFGQNTRQPLASVQFIAGQDVSYVVANLALPPTALGRLRPWSWYWSTVKARSCIVEEPESGGGVGSSSVVVFEPRLSFAEKTPKRRIAGRRLVGHTVAHDGDGIYQDTCFARHQGAGD